MKVLPSMPGAEQAKQQQKLLGKQSCVMVLGQPRAGAQPRTGTRAAGHGVRSSSVWDLSAV